MALQLNLISPHLFSARHKHTDTQTHTHTKIACNNNNPTDDSFSPPPSFQFPTLPPLPPPITTTIYNQTKPHSYLAHDQSFHLSHFFILSPPPPSYLCMFFPSLETQPHLAATPCTVPTVPQPYSVALTPPTNAALVCRFPIHPFFFPLPQSLSPSLSHSPLSLLSLCLPLSPRSWLVLVKYQGKRIPAFFLRLRGVVLCDLALGCISALLMWETQRGREGIGGKEKGKCVHAHAWACVWDRKDTRLGFILSYWGGSQRF